MRIIDTTLREGEQTVGVSFTLHAKKRIIDGLVGLGVDEIELGVVSKQNQELEELVAYVRSAHPEQSISLWCRCLENDIHHAVSLAPDVLSLSIPASDLHLATKMGKDRAWAKLRLARSLAIAAQAGMRKVSVGLEDASRADMGFVQLLAGIAKKGGAFRLRLADTVGIASPTTIAGLLAGVAQEGLELGLHCHNDFGMATANSITGFEHGAMWSDATILGLGERAGNSRLEEIASYLVLKCGAKYNVDGIASFSSYVARLAGRQIGVARPILGRDIFSCETGLHLQGLLTDPATYEPFAPERVGKKRRLYIGSKAGRRSVAITLKRLGVSHFDETKLGSLTSTIRERAASQRRALTDHEILHLARPFCPSIQLPSN